MWLASGAVRRSHALALAALGALLLLLLAARVPPAPAPPRPAPLAPAPAPPAPSVPRANTTAVVAAAAATSRATPRPTTRSTARPTPRPTAHPTPRPTSRPSSRAATAPAPAPRREPGVVLTRDLYEAGHEKPHPELCPALGAKVQLVVLVTSAPGHSAARDAVRLTWGHYAARRDVAFGFVLGAPPAELRAAVDAEDALYGDLIVGRFVDSYSNLTLKTLSMLEWVDTYCPRAPRLLKTDDDMFINIPRLLRFAAARANATNTIWGKVIKKSLPKRTSKSKYYVSPAQFPGKVFPDFATGPAYLVTSDAARALLAAAPAERYLRLEDVFVTGVLAAKRRVRRQHAPEFLNKKVAAHPCAVQRAVSIHMVQFHEQFDLWRKLLDGKTKCAS